jgi:hypothetical protein
MTETVTTGTPGTGTGTGASLGTPAPSAMTPDQAKAEISKLQVDADFRKHLLAGQAEQKQRWSDLLKAAHGKPAQVAEPAANATDIAIITNSGIDLSGDVGADIMSVLSGKPVSAEVKRSAEARWQALKRDRAFAQKFADGDTEARRITTTLALLRSAKTEAA